MKYTKKVLSVLMSLMMGFTVMTTPILAESPSDQEPAEEPEVTEKQEAEETEASEEEIKEQEEAPEVSEEPVKEPEVGEGQEETDQPAETPEAEEKTEKTEEQETVDGKQGEEEQETVEEEQVTTVSPAPVTYDGVTVTVSYLSDAFGGKNVTLVVGKAGSKETAALNELGGEYKAVDISFVDEDGYEVQPVNGSSISVSMKAEGLKDSGNLDVVHVDENGKIDPIRATTKTVKEFTKREKIGETTKTVKVKVPGKKNKTKTEQVKEDVYGDVKYRDVESTFSADSFSVYATVATSFTNGGQYVIYSGTTALAYNGNNLTTATVTIENNTVVRSDSDNIVWTATQQGQQAYRLSHDNRYLRARDWQGLDTRNGGNNDCNWVYSNYNHTLSRGNLYLTLNGNTWGVTTNVNNAAAVYIARVQEEPVTGDLTYQYYNADRSGSISASETITDYPTTWTDVGTLAKEISGYTYLEARANSKDGDVITQVNGKHYRQGSETSGAGHALNSIYFIYMKNYVAGEDVIPGLNGPKTEKHVTHNSDGTFTIQLDITGVVNEVKHGANVVIVFDRTSSMSGNMSNTDRTMRINAAISAVNTLVTTLNPGDPEVEGFYDIDFALVEFDRTAVAYDFGSNGITGHTYWTKSGTAVTSRVGRYEDGANLAASGATPGGGGTNWQAALQETAAVLESKPDADPTYVIFMTDGEPTIYIGSNTVTGGDEEYARSVPYATSIVNADYHMYDIFCSASNTQKLFNLYTASGADSYVMAETQTAVEDAFRDVANDMLDAIGSSEYGVNDGVPELGSFDLDTIDGKLQLSEARYYKKEADATDFADWTDAPVATPSESGVLWDLSSVGTLQKDTVYRVEFEVWPSQAAYDMIADLNNGLKFYDYADYVDSGPDPVQTEEAAIAAGLVLTEDERIQIQEPATADDEYTMKTNTTLSASYKLYGKPVVEDGIDFTAEAMDLPVEPISVKKIWPENMLDEYGTADYRDPETGETRKANEILLTMKRDGEKYMDILVKGSEGWKKDDIYVSNGFMTVKTEGGKKVAHIKEIGHDYQLVEPPEFMYYWDLVSDVYHPMVINGVATVLIYDQDKTAADVDNETYFALGKNSDGTDRIYKKPSSSSNTLEGSNYRRSFLNLTKVITSGDEDALFTYTATVNDSYSTDGYVWFSAWDPVENGIVHDLEVTGAEKETKDIPEGATIDEEAGTCTFINDDGDVETHPTAGDGKYYTGYFYVTNGSQLTVKIKAGWNVRFLNLYHGTTFSFEETDMPGNFEFDKVEADIQYPFIHTSSADWYKVVEDNENGKITGTITEPNNNYTVTYTNCPKPEFYIYHSGIEGDGNLETIAIPRDGDPLTGNWNDDGTYNLYAHTTPGTLYGGYYLDYEGKGDYKDDGVKGTTGVKYTGMNNEWSGAQTVNGIRITPVAGETYYIKEVPTIYLRNYHQITYVKSTGKLTGLYLISALDDLHYNETGFYLATTDKQTAKVASKMTYRNTATGLNVTLTANKVFRNIGITGSGSENNYLTYKDVTKTDYFAPGSFTVLPYWITPDNIEVTGIKTRTIMIGDDMTKSTISQTETDN